MGLAEYEALKEDIKREPVSTYVIIVVFVILAILSTVVAVRTYNMYAANGPAVLVQGEHSEERRDTHDISTFGLQGSR